MPSFSSWIRAKRAMFHILVWNRDAAITSFQENMISEPIAAPVAAHWRSASAPYRPTSSSGTITLPRLLLILKPSSPSTMPFTRICSQGLLPVRATDRRIE